MKNSVILTVVALAMGVTTETASAQDGFDVQQLNPAPAQSHNGIGTFQGQVMGDGEFEVGMFFHHSVNPLVVRGADDTALEGEIISEVVGSQSNLHIMGGFGLFDRLELGADIPLIVSQTGDSSIPNLGITDADVGGGVGDIRLYGKVLFFNTHTAEDPGGGAMSLVLEAFLPSGQDENWQGGEARFAPTLAIDAISTPGHRFTFNFGYTVRPEYVVGPITDQLEVNDTFDWGFTADFLAHQYVSVLLEARGALSVLADDIGPDESPIEANMGLRIRPVEFINLGLGGGVGLFQGFGAPEWRIFFGASYYRAPPQDRDGDGYPNDEDGCPDDPEDFDSFEDEDGCPDPDNDQDGILDTPDECPNQPEDRDGFEDDNGCPDPDNDQDGIMDDPDECPNDPEDMDSFEDVDGCPDPDNDQDGILDDPDQCPNEPEDRDGFEDDNGCPDPDNDQDGILDVDDRCPNDPEDRNGVEDEDGCPEIDTDGDGLLDPVDQCPRQPEDRDGFQDEDGCPDPDNDQDGILDDPDQCPNEPENINGNEDEDGCPDEDLVVVTCDRININDTVHFETARHTIREISFPLLNAVARVFRDRPDILRVRVEGHTDDRGRDQYNMDLSDRRANSVREYLINNGGVEAGRLESQGFGETRPIDSNRTREGRANNRRVEFVILQQTGCQQ